MGISAPCSRARLLNPWTPARPDLKSGAVVLAWLPPRGSHRAIGITPFCVRFGDDPCSQVHPALRYDGDRRRDSESETSFPVRSFRSRMRTRVVWLELSLILLTLTFAELGEVLRELRTDVVLDWFVSLAPLIWINVTIVVLYALGRLYFSSALAPPAPDASRARAVSFLVPTFRILRARANRFRSVWAIASVAYAVAFGFLQGIFVVDLSSSLQPVFVVIESAVGYGP